MAFEGLADRLQNTIQKIRGKGKVSEADVKEMMREVRLALLEADVNFKVVKDFIAKVKDRPNAGGARRGRRSRTPAPGSRRGAPATSHTPARPR